MTTFKAQLNNLRMAPRKVRLLADSIRGLSVNEAEAKLSLVSRRAAPSLLKLLRSAVANAKEINKAINPDHLFIKTITVDGGRMLKRYLPRARGSATPIQKKSSHISLILDENKSLKPKFVIIPKVKKDKSAPKTKTVAKKKDLPTKEKIETQTEKPSLIKKMFRRKSV